MLNIFIITKIMFRRFIIPVSVLSLLMGCDQVGQNPKDVHLKIVQSSPNYDMASKKFVNRRPNIMENMYTH